MFTYRTRTTQSVRWASVIIIITHIIKVTMHPKWENTTSFAHSSDVITRSLQVSTPLITFLVDENDERRSPLSSYAIYLSRSSSPSISPARRLVVELTCERRSRYNNQRTSHFSGSDSLDARHLVFHRPTMPLLAEVSPRTRLYTFVNPITRMKPVALK